MKWLWRDSVIRRTLGVLVLALAAFHLVGFWLFSVVSENTMADARRSGLVERIIAIRTKVNAAPPERREDVAHNLSSGSLDVHWSAEPLISAGHISGHQDDELAISLRRALPDLPLDALRLAHDAVSANAPHLQMIALRLGDGSWLTFSSPILGVVHHLDLSVILLVTMVSLSILVLSTLLLRWVTRPLETLADAADHFRLDAEADPLSETGPHEVRSAARAFNAMRGRITRLVDERTQALAAVSHDLRTPITRLRLRSEFIDDATTRQMMIEDLSEMEAMIDQTLDYLAGSDRHEDDKLFDLTSIVRTLVDQQVDAGKSIRLHAVGAFAMTGRPLSLKRAVGNVIDNAVKYADNVDVSIRRQGDSFVIEVADDGPGIEEAEQERVFVPFYRIDGSRSRASGGVGLGLSIARTIIQAHGARIILTKREPQGFAVTIWIPGSPNSVLSEA